MNHARRLALSVLTLPPLAGLTRVSIRNRAAIFMLHRFEHPERGIEGHSPASIRRALAFLRARGYPLISLRELCERCRAGDAEGLSGAVCFTIDDGYADHAEIAAPIFAEFDCPVTTFVTTGFLDGRIWMWWDRIEYIASHTDRSHTTIVLDDREKQLQFDSEPGRTLAVQTVISQCKEVSDARREEIIARLAEALDVDVPREPPPDRAPMSWDQLREAEVKGMTFGPHTVTHPILSRVTDERSRAELRGSWERLTEEARSPVPVFCYPNGRDRDFGPREVRFLQELGLSGAVVGRPGYAASRGVDGDARFKIPRFAYGESLEDFAQVVTGLERVKEWVRGGRS